MCQSDDESQSESESEFEFYDDEETTHIMKKIAQTLGAFLYTSETAGWAFWRMCFDLRTPISTVD